MNYSKIFITALCLFYLSNCVFAETWKNASIGNKQIYIDTDSINSHNDSIYYNVKYYSQKAGADAISTVQSKGDKAGIISTCKYSDYQKNKSLANPLTTSTLSMLNDISGKSLLYNANEIAKNTNFKNTHKSTPQVISKNLEREFNSYMKEYQNRIKQAWYPPKGENSKRVVVLITLDKKGNLVSCLITQSSGDDATDDAAISAVRYVRGFWELPKDYMGESVDISFSFDYNVIRK